MVAHNGLCLLHRAEIMQLLGAWDDALDETRRAYERYTEGMLNELARGRALYRAGEIHRLRGELAAAEKVYRAASKLGHEPQPGLALLRLSEGKGNEAAAAIRRVIGEADQPLKRAEVLPAYVEIMVAVGEVEEARGACAELGEIAERRRNDVLAALSGQARATLALADGDARAALAASRQALGVWQELGATYELALARVGVALACRALGDEETATLELEAARETFALLGARPQVTEVAALLGKSPTTSTFGLSERELEVLRLVAAGKSNREIAADLVISEHTVARHVQNIFAKLRVSSRAAATAFAFEHDLV
jgi:ATP/maltotriose-dependent transcriptional regulator MalT